MMVRWEIKAIGEIYDVRDGTHDSPKACTEGYPLVTSKNLKDGRLSFDNITFISEADYSSINKRSKVDKGDVLFAMIGTIGNPVLVTETPGFAIKNVALFKARKNQCPNFLRYYLGSQFVIDKMNQEAKGTTQKFVGLGYLREFPIPVPPLKEQERIVAILDKAFAAIHKAKANVQKNLGNANELFTNFLQSILDNKSEGWEEKTLGELIDLVSGQHIDSKDYNLEGKGIGYLTGPSDFGLVHPKVSKWTEYPKQTANQNDILITVKGSGVGKINLMTDGELCISRQLMAIRSKGIDTSFLYTFLSTKFDYFQSLANGAAIPGISRKDVQGLRINIPDFCVQQTIVHQVDAMLSKVQKLETLYEQKLAELEALKKCILKKAFSGQLTEPALVGEAADNSVTL